MFQKLNIWAMALVILSFFNHGQAQQTGGILIFVDQTTSIQSAEFTRWQQDCLGYAVHCAGIGASVITNCVYCRSMPRRTVQRQS